MRLKCFTMNWVRNYRSSGGWGWYRVASYFDRFRSSYAVDADDQRFDLGVTGGRVKIERNESESHEGDQHQRDLQVGVHHQGGAIQLHELTLCILQRFRTQITNRGVHLADPFTRTCEVESDSK